MARRSHKPKQRTGRPRAARTTERVAAAAPEAARGPRDAWIAAGLAALALAVFLPALGHEFVALDDAGYYTENPYLDGRFGLDDVAVAFTRTWFANWTPATTLSIALGDALHGPDPGWVIGVNLALHALAVVLLHLALLRMTRDRWASAFVAAVFAVHPLHVEAVVWASQRKDVLMGVFWMGALLAHARWVERPVPARYAATLTCTALALLSKPAAVTLPFALLLLDFWPLRRFGPGRLGPGSGRSELRAAVVEKLPLLGLAAASSVATLYAQRSAGATLSIQVPFVQRLGNAVQSYAAYLVDAFWPTGLAVYYPYPLGGLDAGVVLGSALLLGLATALCVGLARHRPALGVGWLWFLGTLVPMIGLVQVGTQARADRYMYLPLVGLALAVAFGARDVWRRLGRAGAALAVAVVVVLAVLSRMQVSHWEDTRALFAHALAVTRANPVAHQMLGNEYRREGDLRSAERHLREAQRIQPESPSVPVDLAAVLIDGGRTAEARRELERARAAGVDSAHLHLALGLAAERDGSDAEAIAQYREALAREPDLREAGNNLAWLLATSRAPALRDPDEAIRLAERVAARSRDDAYVLDTLAAAYASAGRWDDAAGAQARALDALDGDAGATLRAGFVERLERYRAH